MAGDDEQPRVEELATQRIRRQRDRRLPGPRVPPPRTRVVVPVGEHTRDGERHRSRQLGRVAIEPVRDAFGVRVEGRVRAEGDHPDHQAHVLRDERDEVGHGAVPRVELLERAVRAPEIARDDPQQRLGDERERGVARAAGPEPRGRGTHDLGRLDHVGPGHRGGEAVEIGLGRGGLLDRAGAHEVGNRRVEEGFGCRSFRERHEQGPDRQHEAQPAPGEQADRAHQALLREEVEARLRDSEAQRVAPPQQVLRLDRDDVGPEVDGGLHAALERVEGREVDGVRARRGVGLRGAQQRGAGRYRQLRDQRGDRLVVAPAEQREQVLLEHRRGFIVGAGQRSRRRRRRATLPGAAARSIGAALGLCDAASRAELTRPPFAAQAMGRCSRMQGLEECDGTAMGLRWHDPASSERAYVSAGGSRRDREPWSSSSSRRGATG